jgi:hypothetical protein
VDVVLGMERVMRKMREATTAPVAAPYRSGILRGRYHRALAVGNVDGGLAIPDAPAEAADPDLERWSVHDLSSKGFGLLVEGAAAKGLLNGILALRNHESGGWISPPWCASSPAA